jgi:hypothetical protein
MMRVYAAFALAATLTTLALPARAQSAVETGVLDCQGRINSYILTSVTDLDCLYTPSVGARPQPYKGTMRLFGVDVQFNQSIRSRWAVFAPTHRIGPGDLAGHYGGASANATLVLGVGANALFGGSNNTVALQPLGVQGQVGIGAAAGISGLDLVPLRPVRHRGHRRHRH